MNDTLDIHEIKRRLDGLESTESSQEDRLRQVETAVEKISYFTEDAHEALKEFRNYTSKSLSTQAVLVQRMESVERDVQELKENDREQDKKIAKILVAASVVWAAIQFLAPKLMPLL